MYGFDFNYEGNHDEVVAEALGVGPAFEGLVEVRGSKVLNFEPSITMALDESCRLQARLSIETRTNAFQVRTGEFGDDQISVYFTVRQYWGNGPDRSFLDSFRRQRAIGEEIVRNHVVPRIVRPLARAIASRSEPGMSLEAGPRHTSRGRIANPRGARLDASTQPTREPT